MIPLIPVSARNVVPNILLEARAAVAPLISPAKTVHRFITEEQAEKISDIFGDYLLYVPDKEEEK